MNFFVENRLDPILTISCIETLWRMNLHSIFTWTFVQYPYYACTRYEEEFLTLARGKWIYVYVDAYKSRFWNPRSHIKSGGYDHWATENFGIDSLPLANGVKSKVRWLTKQLESDFKIYLCHPLESCPWTALKKILYFDTIFV